MTDTPKRFMTNSELKLWRECRRKWWLSQWRRLRIKPELEDLSQAGLGTLVHRGLEALGTPGGDWRAVLAAAEAEAVAMWEETNPTRLADWRKKHLELATIMIEGYEEWLEEEGADQWIEVVAAEERVEAFLFEVDGIEVWLLGKIDQRIRDLYDNTEGFLDFKTVGSLGDIPKRAAVDEQFLHYTLLLMLRDRLTATTMRGGIWRMLRKVKRTARSNPPFYGEHRYRFNTEQLRSYRQRVEFLAEEILQTEAALRNGADPLRILPPTPTGDCNWKCEFRQVCPMFDNGDRVEDFIADWYDEGNPLERYDKEGTE